MSVARIITEANEYLIETQVFTIGRTSDNDLSFPADSNVSRSHAEIEGRDGEYVLIELGSSNGTTVNDEAVERSRILASGDQIAFGGSSFAKFVIDADAQEQPANSERNDSDSPIPTPALSTSDVGAIAPVPNEGSSSTIFVAAAVVCAIAFVCVVAVAAVYLTRGSSCSATARFTKPEKGDSISTETSLEIEVSGGECVARADYSVDGRKVATGELPTFASTIDPAQFPELADGLDHQLKVDLIDDSGNVVFSSEPIFLGFDTAKLKPVATPIPQVPGEKQPTSPTSQAEVSLIQTQEMVQRFAQQFSTNKRFNVSNKEFLLEVRKLTKDYTKGGELDRATAFRDTINTAFVREQNLEAPLAFVLAFERSRFTVAKQADGEGLWRMSPTFVAENMYNGQCGAETLTDPLQNCAARSAALYMKAIVFGVFEGDSIYGAVAFGRSPQDAANWKATLPANRSDLWNTIRTAPDRERLVRFFAAGIVAENPQKFGLTKDKPLSSLYPVRVQ